MRSRWQLPAVALSAVAITTAAFAIGGAPQTLAAITPETPAEIDCGLAKALWQEALYQPFWFPAPQPRGYVLRISADEPQMERGLRWTAPGRYITLLRLPYGTNFYDPFSDIVGEPFVENIGRRIEIQRLSDGRLLAYWTTSSRGPDYDGTWLVSKGEPLAQFTAFLRSLRPVRWPTCCP